MADNLQPAPDWFDRFWDEYQSRLPLYLRGQKKAAREIAGGLVTALASQAATPQGVRILSSFARVQAILKGTQGVLDQPDPTPEQVAEAVQRLVEKVKP
jgi:hypothetical protein